MGPSRAERASDDRGAFHVRRGGVTLTAPERLRAWVDEAGWLLPTDILEAELAGLGATEDARIELVDLAADLQRERSEATNGAEPASEGPWTFVPASDFLAIEFPNPEPLLGARGNRFLAVGSFLLVYGEAGAAKSTLTIDGVAHLAAGLDWLGQETPRPVRFLLIENEGAPGLLQEKLAEKEAASKGDTDWLANVFLFEHPWGQFSFKNENARARLRDYCLAQQIDVVIANPLLGLGASGAGKPEETALFVEWLKECGLWRDLAFWLVHHENKAGQISGDWGRHPDTVVLLQRDGNRPRTKLTWEKTRWASTGTDEQARTVLLEWLVETKSYQLVDVDTAGVSDSELIGRLEEFLAANPGVSTKAVYEGVTGDNTRLRMLLDKGVEEQVYSVAKGSRGALLWTLGQTTSLFAPADTSDDVDGKPHE